MQNLWARRWTGDVQTVPCFDSFIRDPNNPGHAAIVQKQNEDLFVPTTDNCELRSDNGSLNFHLHSTETSKMEDERESTCSRERFPVFECLL